MRVTRKESQAHTRARLREAATEIIAHQGVAGLGLRSVCEAAGYSQGAFYSNFGCKDDLLTTLMSAHIATESHVIAELIETTQDLDFDATLQALAQMLTTREQDTLWALTSIELQLYAARCPDFAQSLAQARAQGRAAIAELIEALCARFDLRTALPASEISTGLFALWTGMILQTRLRPEGEPQQNLSATEMCLTFLRAALGVGAQHRPPPAA